MALNCTSRNLLENAGATVSGQRRVAGDDGRVLVVRQYGESALVA